MSRNDVLYMAYGAGLRTSVIRFTPHPDLVFTRSERATRRLKAIPSAQRNVIRHLMPNFSVRKWWK